MTANIQPDNRRKYVRFPINGCTLFNELKIGRVVDISHGGMSFYYADRTAWPETSCQTGTIRIRDKSLAIDLPLETISDIELPHNYSDGSMTVRRRSVKFGQLTNDQIEQINEVINLATSI